jgi:hypothetical protein
VDDLENRLPKKKPETAAGGSHETGKFLLVRLSL